MAECQTFIADAFVFPRRPANRPALRRVAYRIASYPAFVELMTRHINQAVELRAWTHRGADDPGIALLQGAATLGDILTFYQEHYANEAFLRTATWRESIAALTRLTGYRLAPGVGGRAAFAFEVKGARPVEIPGGHPLKVELDGAAVPADFETTTACTAYPHLSRFHFYRPRQYSSTIGTTAARLEISAVGGLTDAASLDALPIKAGDRLMLVPAAPAWLSTGTSLTAAQQAAQVVKVKSVTRRLGRTIVELAATLRESWAQPVTAYRIGRSFRHFGHVAPAKYTENATDAGGTITGAIQRTTLYRRHINGPSCSLPSWSSSLTGYDIPLDQAVTDLLPGGRVLVQTRVQNGSSGSIRAVTVERTIAAVRAGTLGFGTLTGATTIVTLSAPLSSNGSLSDLQSDVRDYEVHEVTSAALTLKPEAHFSDAAFTTGTAALRYFGTRAEVAALAGRRLLLQRGDAADAVELLCTSEAADFVLAAGAADEPRMWSVSFDRPPAPFVRADFDETAPAVTVFGNVVDADQGRSETEVPVGNGDAGASFQTFRIPKAPLTYHVAAGATPPQVPALDVIVSGRVWQRVDSLFGRGPAEEVYVVREDADGASYIQFGDGDTGARLPSGVGNVVVRYRSGNGAFGAVKPGTTPSSGRRIDGLDKVQLPGIVSGGAAAESGEKAASVAPGRLQSLGRIVSLSDFETEVLTIPGVVSATASWGLSGGVATLLLRVLLEAGRESEFAAVRDAVQAYGRCRGADRFPVTVEQATFRYTFLDLAYAADPTLVAADVEAAIRAALGLVGDTATERSGLFGLRARRLGAREYSTRIEGVVQNVTGVQWARVSALGMFGDADDDPAALGLPPVPRPLAATLTPAANQLLQLDARHLTITAAAAAAGVCA